MSLRTFPRVLAAFRKVVDERGQRLRKLPFAEIKARSAEPIDQLTVESRHATIATIILQLQSGGVQVVLQGFLNHKIMPRKSVALHGFYKYPDETIAEMKNEEFWEFD